MDFSFSPEQEAIRETALFYTRQRTQDLLTQMAVTVQGYLALDLVKKNNVELVKGVDRASTTTVSALPVAHHRRSRQVVVKACPGVVFQPGHLQGGPPRCAASSHFRTQNEPPERCSNFSSAARG